MRPYIVGSTFFIHTDHHALQWLFKMKEHNAKLCRWAILLSQYDFGILYKAGRKHKNADFMSRSLGMTEGKIDQLNFI